MKSVLLLSLLSLLGASQLGFGFPEMVRHGYPNCITCHVSPDGGGVLTQYGRSLSAQVLSTWSYEGETKYLYFIQPPDWLNLGGDARWVQTYKNTDMERSGRFIFMQADGEAAATVGRLTFDATLGKNYFPDDSPHSFTDNFISRRFYAMVKTSDDINIRAGKFMPAFGIHTPDHIIVTKQDLGWGEGTESYNLETSWTSDNFDFFLTGVFGQLDSQSEVGPALRASYTLDNTYKLGVSYFYGSSSMANRHVFGPYFILGFTPHFFLLSEIDFQSSQPKLSNMGSSTFGWVNYHRLDYEWIQGFHTFMTAEISKLDFSNVNTLTDAFGGGIQFFPRPHFEADLVYEKKRNGDQGNFYDYAFFMFHFYP